MPGRQAHGRSLTAAPKAKAVNKKSKARSQKNALDAFGIAQEKFPTKQKKTPRSRELDAEIERKHGRDDEDGEDEDEEEDEPSRKKAKKTTRSGDDNVDYGSDSEGNEWQLGGLADDDDDSEIESDDAFGDSDNEKFEEYSFRGSKAKKRKDDESEDSDDGNDDEGETLGADAIDLATALDQWEEESDEEPEGSENSESDSEESGEEETDDSEADDESEEDGETSPEKLEALQGLVADYGGEVKEDDTKVSAKQKVNLSDLGLTGLNDPFMKKSVKLMTKEEKEKRPGASKKLDTPLSRREQGRLDRAAAYEKTNETLDRWTETVKHNRRAEHLIFPLPQNSATEGVDMNDIQPLTAKTASNELESTIMSIMEQSGLSMEKKANPRPKEYDEEGNELSRREALNKKRLQRELDSREEKRAKRIKKIKSKSYHRVHRRQRERDDMATREAMEEAGEIDSEEEREAQDRRRALERVGQRHKESKWAKLGSRAKRAVWDDDFRAGLTEMARKDEELRRRKEGKTGHEDDSDATSSSGSDSDDATLRRQLDELDEEGDEPRSALMSMKFMQKAEAAKKKANDDLVKQIRRDLDGDEAQGSDEEEVEEVGRRQFGTAGSKPFEMAIDTSKRSVTKGRLSEDHASIRAQNAATMAAVSTNAVWASATPAQTAASAAGAWSTGEVRRKKKNASSARIEDLDLNANVVVAAAPRPAKSKASKAVVASGEQDSGSDSDDADQHLPLAIRDQELVARAFAGEDVVGEFEREKADVAEADDDKIIDNTLPGWGSWVGDGVSAKEKKRHQGRFLTKVEGVKKKDRKDSKLEQVIINEKRIKKHDRYLASQLPHSFESKQQYERSLRLPVGPEWMTKETFQDTTKPRVLMKNGIIAPMSKPIV